MKASELQPAPRCPFVGKEQDTGRILKCARWVGHPDDHESYRHVLQQMCDALLALNGQDLETIDPSVAPVILKQAQYWYERLVI